jgi:hypothetical protein
MNLTSRGHTRARKTLPPENSNNDVEHSPFHLSFFKRRDARLPGVKKDRPGACGGGRGRADLYSQLFFLRSVGDSDTRKGSDGDRRNLRRWNTHQQQGS